MNTEQELDQLILWSREAQSQIDAAFSRLRHLAAKAGDEQRQLRNAAMNANLEVFTEEEAAKELKTSEATMRRLRSKYRGTWPHFRVGALVRYTNFDLVEITKLLSKRIELREAGSERRRKTA